MSKDTDRRDPGTDRDTGVITKRRVKRPPLYRVIFHNDDYTTRDFVVMVLMRYFHKTHPEATRLMLDIHHKGQGVAGIYPHDIAKSKILQVERLARQNEMPLKLTLEPDSNSGGEGDE